MSDHPAENGDPAPFNLGLLNSKHVYVFLTALEKILASEIAETTFSEIVDGLPMKATWLQYDNWKEDHPVNVLGHEMMCDGAREKARRFRDELDIYMLSFPPNYPAGIADVVGYWAEARIFGGVVVFDRGPSGVEPGDCPCPLPIKSSQLNGYRYNPHDAMSRYNIFRDRYERNEPEVRSNHRVFMDGRNWPEVQYLFKWMELQEKKAAGIDIDEAELAAVEEGMRRITPSSPQWFEPEGV
ncbi:hypothetical protein KVR01_013251 [Diaporthe batatas]|uniref:uncharacterized protein n=1 Tax=Diaporthe batatas TaxID=748121 RepID=UPI001D048C0A|nr:uncharacterized protein KVR01_013251 [Diaporthe batatas]KAG8156838.1 hypothetical protein KVR01_013251 [Diaporthe batatas]